MVRGLHAIVALTLALTACEDVGGVATPAPATSAATTTTPPLVDDAKLVRQALAKTREAGTATFVAEATIALFEGTVTVRREGRYDLRTGRSSLTQTVSSSPPELLRELDDDLRALRRAYRMVTTPDSVHLMMTAPGTPTPWVRFPAPSSRDAAPPMLAMLSGARYSPKDGSFRSRVPPLANVALSAEDAFPAFPSDLVASLLSAGADEDDMTGAAEVIVEVDRGVVTTVFYEIGDLVSEAYSQIGRGGAGFRFSRVAATLHVNDLGKPVTIEVPRT